MSGIDRLRALAGAWDEWGLGGALADIAEQIERERDDEVADSPYDAILPKDREAISWVCDHGGIEGVSRLFQDADSRRVELCAALGIDLDKGWSDAMAAMRLRLMPEGMEWPRFDDGEPVQTGATFAEKGTIKNVVASVELSDDWFAVHGFDGAIDKYSKGERVKRYEEVLAADGEPLEVGQTVHDKDTGDRFEVTGFSDDGFVICWDVDKCESDVEILPSQLTHTNPEPPDSWERLDEDAEKNPCDYFGFDGEETCGKCPASGKNCEQTMASDLVRRARALAEKENRNE